MDLLECATGWVFRPEPQLWGGSELLWGWTGHYLCLVRRPHVQSFDGVTDGHVSVHAHDGQREGTGKHVIVVDGHHRLTQDVPEGPETQEHVCALRTSRENRPVDTWLILEQGKASAVVPGRAAWPGRASPPEPG